MRRIPRPSRAIDPPKPFCSSVRQRITAPACTHLRIASAALSTTPSRYFLLPGKQDKKKHQQFVRRWQKRLLGDSEPIGAHVDPYDPTSPVRIAPEEQGEYEEVLDEGADFPVYTPAERSRRLLRVGSEQWLRQKLEGDMAKEFEKLTRRTYTPLTLDMADEIEELTGTPYTLRDENLMMAQTMHHVTGKPYTDYNFGLHGKTTTPNELRSRFIQAVAEVYALKQAGLDMDLSKLANRGVYDCPRWVRDIRLFRTESGNLALAFPKHKTAEQFLKVMQTVPTWELAQVVEEDDPLVGGGTSAPEPDLLQKPPTMDPNTPAFKKAAVVKMDADKKPFDFMSNRPVPRAKPVEKEIMENLIAIEESRTQAMPSTSSSLTDLASAVQLSGSTVSELRRSIIELRASHLADNVLALKNAAQLSVPASSASKIEEDRWRHVPITDLAVKFAVRPKLVLCTLRHGLTDTSLAFQTPLPTHWPPHLRPTAIFRQHAG